MQPPIRGEPKGHISNGLLEVSGRTNTEASRLFQFSGLSSCSPVSLAQLPASFQNKQTPYPEHPEPYLLFKEEDARS